MSAPVLLAIDTSGPRLQLALTRGDLAPDVLIEDIATGHAELLFDRIAILLERNGIGHADLTRIAVTTGPGSFTGLRIGLSAARGLGLARALPVVGIPTLLALSLHAPAGRTVDVLLDARRSEAYFQHFAAPGIPLGVPVILPMDAARAQIDASAILIESPMVDIAAMAIFARDADADVFPPDPVYVRPADAKPQSVQIARAVEQAK